jgi:hypothetical protein
MKIKDRAKSKAEMDSRKVGCMPMYRKMEGSYASGMMLLELNEKKKILSEIRDFHKPIRKTEISNHSKKMELMVREKNIQRKKERDDKYVENLLSMQKFKSKIITKVALEDKMVATELVAKK